MKKGKLAILLCAALIVVAAGIFAGCMTFSSTVPEYYYSYDIDLSKEESRAIYDKYDGTVVLVDVTRYDRRGLSSVFGASSHTSGVYVSADGWLALPASAFETGFGVTVDRYSVQVSFLDTQDGKVSMPTFRNIYYNASIPEYAAANVKPISENIAYDLTHGVAIVKMPIEDRELKYADLTDIGAPQIGEELRLFSLMLPTTSTGGGRLISGALVMSQGIGSATLALHEADYIPYGGADYLVGGNFHDMDVGGLAVNGQGLPVGIVFSRVFDSGGSGQNSDIYGMACMCDISHVKALLQAKGAENA